MKTLLLLLYLCSDKNILQLKSHAHRIQSHGLTSWQTCSILLMMITHRLCPWISSIYCTSLAIVVQRCGPMFSCLVVLLSAAFTGRGFSCSFYCCSIILAAAFTVRGFSGSFYWCKTENIANQILDLKSVYLISENYH